MIKINTLAFRNCFAYGEETQTIDMRGRNLTQIVGLNGAAKSSIALILEELFFSKNSKGVPKADIPNRYVVNPVQFMQSGFSVHNDEYSLTKTVSKSTTKLVLLKNEEDISGHTATQTYKLLHEILAVDFNTFSKLVYQSMSSSLDFLTATDTARKKFLIGLLALDKYVEVEDTLKEARKEQQALVDSLAKEVSKYENTVVSIQIPEIQSIDEVPEAAEDFDKLQETLNITLGKLMSTQEHHSTAKAEYQRTVKSRKDLTDGITKVTTELSKLENEKDSIELVLEPLKDPLLEKLPELEKQLTQVQWEMTQVKKKYKETKAQADKVACGECGTELDTRHAESLTASYQSNFVELAARRDELVQDIDNLQRVQKAYDTELSTKYKTDNLFKELGSKILASTNRLEELRVQLNSLDIIEEPEALEDISAQIINSKAELAEVRDRKETFNSLRDKVLQENLQAERSIALREAKLEQLEEVTQSLSKSKSQLGVEEDSLSKLSVLCNIFGPKGLIGYKIESSVKVFEEQLNHYLGELSKGQMALGFELEDSKLKVVIFSSGVPVSIKTLSSGELSKVNIATLLSIRNLMSKISKTHINTLFLDEIVSVIDTEGMEDLIQVLLKEEHLNTFLVSHGYTHPLVDVLQVEKVNNISRISGGYYKNG